MLGKGFMWCVLISRFIVEARFCLGAEQTPS
jgi:hypothetical protein